PLLRGPRSRTPPGRRLWPTAAVVAARKHSLPPAGVADWDGNLPQHHGPGRLRAAMVGVGAVAQGLPDAAGDRAGRVLAGCAAPHDHPQPPDALVPGPGGVAVADRGAPHERGDDDPPGHRPQPGRADGFAVLGGPVGGGRGVLLRGTLMMGEW